MPIEIRELVIKTEIRNDAQEHAQGLGHEEFQKLKHQIIAECKKSISAQLKKKQFNR